MPCPTMRAITSLKPPMSPGLSETISTRQPLRSAKRAYIRKRSPAKSADSSPPVPPRISRKTLRSSLGSLGSSACCSSSSRRSIRADAALRPELGSRHFANLAGMTTLRLVRKMVDALEQRQQLGPLGFAGLIERLRRAVQEFAGKPARELLEHLLCGRAVAKQALGALQLA